MPADALVTGLNVRNPRRRSRAKSRRLSAPQHLSYIGNGIDHVDRMDLTATATSLRPFRPVPTPTRSLPAACSLCYRCPLLHAVRRLSPFPSASNPEATVVDAAHDACCHRRHHHRRRRHRRFYPFPVEAPPISPRKKASHILRHATHFFLLLPPT